MTRRERQSLREAALRAVSHSSTRPWALQTSNSFRRIGALGDGDVLCAIRQSCDGHPDLLSPSGVLDYIIAAQPLVVLELLGALDEAEDALNQVRGTVEAVTKFCPALGDVKSSLQSVEQGPIRLDGGRGPE